MTVRDVSVLDKYVRKKTCIIQKECHVFTDFNFKQLQFSVDNPFGHMPDSAVK